MDFKAENPCYSSLGRGELLQVMFFHMPETLKPFFDCIAKDGKKEIKRHFNNDLKPVSGVTVNDSVHTLASYLVGFYDRLSRHVHNVDLQGDEIAELLDLVPEKFLPIDKGMAVQISNLRSDMNISLIPIPAPSDPPAFETRSEFERRLLEECKYILNDFPRVIFPFHIVVYEEDYQYGFELYKQSYNRKHEELHRPHGGPSRKGVSKPTIEIE